LVGPRTDETEEQEESPDARGLIAMGDEEEIDEDEVIDVAEQIFVRIAEAIIK
jgi:hypothetical protein